MKIKPEKRITSVSGILISTATPTPTTRNHWKAAFRDSSPRESGKGQQRPGGLRAGRTPAPHRRSARELSFPGLSLPTQAARPRTCNDVTCHQVAQQGQSMLPSDQPSSRGRNTFWGPRRPGMHPSISAQRHPKAQLLAQRSSWFFHGPVQPRSWCHLEAAQCESPDVTHS